MSIYEIVSGLVAQHDQLDDDDLAQMAIRAASPAELAPLVLNIVRAARRRLTRAAEREVARLISNGVDLDRIETRKILLNETFPLEDGTFVSWGEATIADHQKRLEVLCSKRDGLNATIALHHHAIEKIAEHGARCLNDVLEVAA